MPGKLIAIEGIDGSGKTVQSHLLMERLKKKGLPVEVIKFPRRGEGFFGKIVGRYITGEFGSSSEVNPYLAALLYAGERFELKGQIGKWLEDGKTVIARRYVASNKAHQGGKVAESHHRKRFFEWVEELEYKIFGNPRADINVLLDVPFELARELINKRHKEAPRQEHRRDIHEEDPRHLKGAQETYKELASGPEPWVVIPCVKNGRLLHEGEIAEKVWLAVEKVVT